MQKSQNIRFIVRSAELSDLDALYSLSKNSTLLNLPTDKELLHEKIITSIASFSFQSDIADPQYIFVLEDQATGEVTGTSTLFTCYVSKSHPLVITNNCHY